VIECLQVDVGNQASGGHLTGVPARLAIYYAGRDRSGAVHQQQPLAAQERAIGNADAGCAGRAELVQSPTMGQPVQLDPFQDQWIGGRQHAGPQYHRGDDRTCCAKYVRQRQH
jgi:hypothetical protein